MPIPGSPPRLPKQPSIVLARVLKAYIRSVETGRILVSFEQRADAPTQVRRGSVYSRPAPVGLGFLREGNARRQSSDRRERGQLERERRAVYRRSSAHSLRK